MILTTSSQKLSFTRVDLVFFAHGITDLFAQKNNRTVQETLASKKYAALLPAVQRRYPSMLSQPLGVFVVTLKTQGDNFYRRFLNDYGDLTYCDFAISSGLEAKGLYCYAVTGEVVYIGKTHDSFGKRINQGYGHLSPKNCYKDGRATNCHINALMAAKYTQVECYICPLQSKAVIDEAEKELIQGLQPPWNIALKN